MISKNPLVLTPYFAYLSDKVVVVTLKKYCSLYGDLTLKSQNIQGKIGHFYKKNNDLFEVLSNIQDDYEEFANYSFVILFEYLPEEDVEEILAEYCDEDAILLILDPQKGFYKCMFKGEDFVMQNLAKPSDILYK